ncbi:hypothetical protein LWI29_019050 [Acer saccharum]|uniref:Cyclin-dependent kinases regulatory subunit n=1 Tax=Acer saccharum TaxID=4024 RepID=A0AA39T3L0_ACESA|nr:hypothetical protein LWI29_019050 [Acer saccharum]
MANGADSEDKFVVRSKIRPCSKREFEFVMRNQKDYPYVARTRSRQAQDNVESGDGLGSPQNKKLKTYVLRKKRMEGIGGFVGLDKETEVLSEEEAKSDVVDVDVVEAKVDSTPVCEREDDLEKGLIGEKEVLVYDEEGQCEYDQVEDEKSEPETAVDDFEKEKFNECDKGSMDDVVEDRYEKIQQEENLKEMENWLMDFEKENNDEFFKSLMGEGKIQEEMNELENAVIGAQKEVYDVCDEYLMDFEEDRCEEKHQEQVNESEKTTGVYAVEDEKSAPDNAIIDECFRELMYVEEVVHKEMVAEKENEPEKAIGVGEEKKNDTESGFVENALLKRLLETNESDNLCEEGTSAIEPIVAGGNDEEKVPNGVVERPLETKESDNLCEEGTSAIGPIVVGGNDEEKVPNGVVERPLRRFTRSMLQQKVDSAVNDIGNEKDANEVLDGGDDGVAITSAKKAVRKFCTKLKDFLDLGILEGMSVKYIRSAKGKGTGVTGLQGVIKGPGILCFCDDCKGNEVVSPNVFELHAGSSNKRPPEYIYLENGKTLRDVMNACKVSPLETLEEALQMVIGSSTKTSAFCLNCRGSIMESGMGPTLLCNTCTELKESLVDSVGLTDTNACMELIESQVGSVGLTDTSEGSPEPKSVRKSSHSTSKSSCSSKLQGKITRKDLRMHKLVFEKDGLPDGTEVAYFVRGQKLLVGYKFGCGIMCSCCNSEVSPSQFEAHAGWASRRKPFHHIFTSNGVSLHEFSVLLSREQEIPSKENDDLCGLCMDGGNLLCCDTCPRAFHLDCLGLAKIPSGTWYCKYCSNALQNEKSVEHNANAIAAGRVPGVDPIAQITNRCIRIVKSPDFELGGCVLCRGRDFCRSGFGSRTVMLCDQCEREYHVGCLKENGMEDLKELPEGKWLCCAECKRTNLALQKLICRGEEKLPDTCMNVIKKKREEVDACSATDVDVRWRVLKGKKVDTSDCGGLRTLLSKAVAIFHDCFDPIIESVSKTDLIPSMVYGRSLKTQDFHGMYCAILTVNQVVVSAGIFRIFGEEVAELPLVATSKDSQGQGYFQSLFSCIEKLLGFLHVKNLVLPSASEAESIWTNKFGFDKMTEEEQNKFRNDYPLIIFQGTSMLQKKVPKYRFVGKDFRSRPYRFFSFVLILNVGSRLAVYDRSFVITNRNRNMGQIQYSEKYFDDAYEYRHVVLPPDVAKLLPKNRLLSETEWRAIGVQQSRGWVHYAVHRPEPHIMLFRRPLNYQQQQENQAQQSLLAK